MKPLKFNSNEYVDKSNYLFVWNSGNLIVWLSIFNQITPEISFSFTLRKSIRLAINGLWSNIHKTTHLLTRQYLFIKIPLKNKVIKIDVMLKKTKCQNLEVKSVHVADKFNPLCIETRRGGLCSWLNVTFIAFRFQLHCVWFPSLQ